MLAFGILKNLFKKSETKEVLHKAEIKPENNIPVIDVSEPAEQATQELLAQWEKFANYDEILQIDEADRKMLLKDIYESWNIHGIPKFFKRKYAKYDENLIDFIYRKENARHHIGLTLYPLKNLNDWYRLFWSIEPSNDYTFNGAICQAKDILNFTNEFDYWENGCYCPLNIRPALLINDKLIKLYHNNSLHIFNLKDFKKYRDKYNIDLYFSKEKIHNILNKSERI